jgi:FAD/FMN-containing dehydrogenase
LTDVIQAKKEDKKERNIFENISKEEVFEDLVKIFGKEYVTDKPHDLYPYSYDMTEVEPHMPDFVVLPDNVDEIVQLINFCNSNKIPIIPYVTGNNVGGLTIPEHGGIICDMGKRMNRILAVHESLMYAILEPGVTFGHLKRYLDDNYPKLKYTYPLAPPYASVVMNALLAGESNITAHGTTADWVNGVEVVLNNGEVVRTGTSFVSKELKYDNWYYRQSIPDLTGLFVCWQGLTGIVTKCAIKLVPKKEFNTALAIVIYGNEACADVQKAMGRTECCEDVAIINVEVVKMLFDKVKPKIYDDEPDWAILLSISAQTKELLQAKVNYVKKVFEKVKEKHNRIFLTNYYTFRNLVGDVLNRVYDLPEAIPLLYYWNSITWVGTYGNPDNFAPLMDECRKLYKKYDLEPFIYMKSMNNGHYGLFRVITRYNQEKEEETVKKLQQEVLDVLLDYDCVPDKTPVWVAEKMREKCDPNWFKLLERIKKAMDPNNIFNPGKWGLD